MLVCFAVPQEAAPFRRRIRSQPGIDVLVTGMGPERALHALQRHLQSRRPSLVFTCGFAGGLNPALRPLSVVVHRDDDFPIPESAFRAHQVYAGSFSLQRRVLVTPAEKTALHRTTKADAVDMESGVIRAHCAALGIPSATLRVISDTAEEALPLDFNRYMTASGSFAFHRLVADLIRHPGTIPRLIAFQKRIAAAAEALATTLHPLVTGVGRFG